MMRVGINYVTATGRLESEQRAYGTETDSEESSEDSIALYESALQPTTERPIYTAQVLAQTLPRSHLLYTLGLGLPYHVGTTLSAYQQSEFQPRIDSTPPNQATNIRLTLANLAYPFFTYIHTLPSRVSLYMICSQLNLHSDLALCSIS